MRIMILLKFPLFGGGSGTYTRKLAENLAKNPANQVAVVAPDKRQLKGCKTYTIKPAFKAVFESHPEYKRPKKYSELTGWEFARQYEAYMHDICHAVEDFKPDVIHVNHASFLTWIASFIKSMYGIGYVVTVHGTDIFNSTVDTRYKVLTRQALQRAELILPVSYHTKKWFLKVFGQDLRRKTKVVSNGISLDEFPRTGSVKSIEKKYNLDDKKLVIFVGRLTFEKGVEYLIRSAKHIKAEIYIIGGGVYRDYLRNYAKLVGAKNVHFLGYFGKEYIGELREFYRRADVLVLPSVVEESTGYAVLEAMACGTPVVASNKGGIPIVVKNGQNGFLVRARSSSAITKAVNTIINNPEIEAKFKKNARKIIEERFNWGVLTPQVEEIYKKVRPITERMQQNRKKSLYDKEKMRQEKQELKKKIDYIS